MIGFKNIGHMFAVAFRDTKVGAKAVAGFLTTHSGQIITIEREVGAVASAFVPGAAGAVESIARISEAVMGETLAAANTVGNADSPEGLLVKIPTDLVPDIKALLATLSNHPAVVASVAK